ncbi:MAG: amidohydrolase [Pseudomonadota bacterium]
MRLAATLILLAGLAVQNVVAAPDVIFHGGPIITLDADDQIAQAIAVEDGRIVAVGDFKSISALATDETDHIDLEGKPLLPGFVDSHSHAGFLGLQAMAANLLPAPDGRGNSVAAIQEILQAYIASEAPLIEDLGWVIGFGYDDSQLDERAHPTRRDLDEIEPNRPVLLIHQSGHLGVANSAALKVAGVSAETLDPKGGVFRREEGTLEPNGVMEEYAFFRLIYTAMAGADENLQDEMVRQGTRLMATYGYTTAQDGRTDPQTLGALTRVAVRGELDIDVVSFPDMLTLQSPPVRRQYRNRFRVGGVKLTIDGSPQGKTAWLTKPYHVPPLGQNEAYAGYPAITVDVVDEQVLKAFKNDWQIQVHANGDAAIDALILAVQAARDAGFDDDRRPVLIHGQTLRKDQVARLDELGIFPSLFPMHTFYWGDWHYESVLGPERAEDISPTGWVRERGMRFGSHHDAPVALPDSMRVLSATVTRRTRSGRVLGAAQRVDVATGLRSLTIWPAWQHFEENSKGSLEVGKLADLVVLSDNPFEVPEETLADLKVNATYKEGRLIYERPAAP